MECRPIREWLYAGPFDKDVSHLYEDNYIVPVEPYLPMIEEACQIMNGLAPAEGESVVFLEQESMWSFARTGPSEKKMTWARYGTHARLLVTYAYSRLIVLQSGIYRCRLWLYGSAAMMLNGEIIFTHQSVGRVDEEFVLDIHLQEGDNECLLMLANVHLHCTNSFSLTIESEGIQAYVPLLLGNEGRTELEEDLGGFYLASPVIQGEDSITVQWDRPVASKGTFIFTVHRGNSGVSKGVIIEIATMLDEHQRSLRLASYDELPAGGQYLITVDYRSEQSMQSGLVTGITLQVIYVDYFAEMVPSGNYKERQRYLLEQTGQLQLAEIPEPALYGIYRELSRLESGMDNEVDVQSIRKTLSYINERYDCADFAMHGLLRIYYKHRTNPILPNELKEEMKACILGFKYWVDEPGKSLMFTRSENHEILFFSAEYLAGLLFPADNFTNSNQNGLFHALKGRLNAERWIKEKGMYGFTEWHSNTYYEEDLLAMLNLFDFSEENSPIRILAKQLIDLILAFISSHSYQGIMGTTHGRCYEQSIIYPELESMRTMNWLLFGLPKIMVRKLSIGAVSLASSCYEPLPAWEHIASSTEPLLTRTRMGLFPSSGMGGVNTSTFRTEHYMVSGLVESKKGEFSAQAQAGQILLDGGVPVFVSCFDNKSKTTRPSYWGGQYRMPKTIAYRNVLVYIYRIDSVAGFTHCYFPTKQFDQVREHHGWLFGQKGDAYVAVYSLKPYHEVTEGEYGGRELLCLDKQNIWLLEAGSVKEWGSFDSFAKSISEAPIELLGEDILYTSPSIGKVELGWERICTVKGIPVLEDDYPLIDNPYAFGEYGSGIIKLNLSGIKKTLNFQF
ncbi:hypothetical protein OB236_06625 [Paenibacillus sp. WQ 127069]|uniref:Heparin-sulfate lyase N-terminal domain-containing protein n=1 Tax=Paenibacillus baimaensis TaxID=2982185 RepID=A0ABT2UAZ0_9BACL|nr:hypothetical protein [Paenibacillus sp. WQ 127069]MCU6791804.1 hypothetical protein [Paenibacillus sp. WQ 127069]